MSSYRICKDLYVRIWVGPTGRVVGKNGATPTGELQSEWTEGPSFPGEMTETQPEQHNFGTKPKGKKYKGQHRADMAQETFLGESTKKGGVNRHAHWEEGGRFPSEESKGRQHLKGEGSQTQKPTTLGTKKPTARGEGNENGKISEKALCSRERGVTRAGTTKGLSGKKKNVVLGKKSGRGGGPHGTRLSKGKGKGRKSKQLKAKQKVKKAGRKWKPKTEKEKGESPPVKAEGEARTSQTKGPSKKTGQDREQDLGKVHRG